MSVLRKGHHGMQEAQHKPTLLRLRFPSCGFRIFNNDLSKTFKLRRGHSLTKGHAHSVLTQST